MCSKLGLIPVEIKQDNSGKLIEGVCSVSHTKFAFSGQKQLTANLIVIFSLFLPFARLLNSTEIVASTYLGLMFACRLTGGILLSVSQFRARELCHLFNNLVMTSSTYQLKEPKSNLFSFIYVSLNVLLFTVFYLGTSFIPYFYPSRNTCLAFPSQWEVHMGLRLGILILELTLNLIPTLVGSLHGSLTLIVLNLVYKKVEALKVLQRDTRVREIGRSERLAVLYCQLQIFLKLVNDCMANGAILLTQISGGGSAILALWSILVFGETLKSLVLLFFIALLILISCYVILSMDVGSWPISASQKFLTEFKGEFDPKSFGGLSTNERKWKRMFIRACQPVCFQVGPFHKLDRARGPALIRFCLQRTFFLVVNSRAQH